MMKRASLALFLAAVLVVAVASAASAATGSTYAAWTIGGGNAASLPTPHKDFRLTTVKCAVCHAIHKAELGGEILLRDTVANACSYCHIQTATGVTQLYGGQTAYYTNSNDQFAHNTGASNCSDCHSTHGANTVSNAALSSKILRNEVGPTYRAYQATILAAGGYDVTTSPRFNAESAWCTKCHRYFVNSHETAVTYLDDLGGMGNGLASTAQAKMHIMTTASASYDNPNASPAAQGQVVATAGSTTCRACHDAGQVDLGATVTVWSFPHYTANAARFLMAATSSVSATVPAGAGFSGISGTAGGPVDGVCLKCHTNGTTIGVGINF
jgi:hypothetical protein